MSLYDKKIILSPMAGITDLPFRLLCKEHGADVLYSEMISAAGLTYNKSSQSKTLELVKSCKENSPLILQLFGSNPKDFAQATKIIDGLPSGMNVSGRDALQCVSTLKRPEGVDINFGCPVKKVIKQGAGCVLMKDPKLSREIIKSVTANTSLPVSIKIRAGIENIDAEKFLEKISDLDWGSVIIHGRTYQEGFFGSINMEMIQRIKGNFPSKKIIANGGVLVPEKAKEVLEKTNADGVAIARGCLGNPWIFQNIKTYLGTGSYSPPGLTEIKKTALQHAELVEKYKGEKAIIEFRKHLGWYTKGLPNAKSLRSALFKIDCLDDIEKILNLKF